MLNFGIPVPSITTIWIMQFFLWLFKSKSKNCVISLVGIEVYAEAAYRQQNNSHN